MNGLPGKLPVVPEPHAQVFVPRRYVQEHKQAGGAPLVLAMMGADKPSPQLGVFSHILQGGVQQFWQLLLAWGTVWKRLLV